MKDDLQQDVAELVGERAIVAAVDGVADLVGLLDDVGLEGCVGLLGVPRTPARSAQPVHRRDQILESLAGSVAHFERSLRRAAPPGNRAIRATGSAKPPGGAQQAGGLIVERAAKMRVFYGDSAVATGAGTPDSLPAER